VLRREAGIDRAEAAAAIVPAVFASPGIDAARYAALQDTSIWSSRGLPWPDVRPG
jgi:hypothetical protein